MNDRAQLQELRDDLYDRLAQLDIAGESVAAAHLDAAVTLLNRSIELLPTATEME